MATVECLHSSILQLVSNALTPYADLQVEGVLCLSYEDKENCHVIKFNDQLQPISSPSKLAGDAKNDNGLSEAEFTSVPLIKWTHDELHERSPSQKSLATRAEGASRKAVSKNQISGSHLAHDVAITTCNSSTTSRCLPRIKDSSTCAVAVQACATSSTPVSHFLPTTSPLVSNACFTASTSQPLDVVSCLPEDLSFGSRYSLENKKSKRASFSETSAATTNGKDSIRSGFVQPSAVVTPAVRTLSPATLSEHCVVIKQEPNYPVHSLRTSPLEARISPIDLKPPFATSRNPALTHAAKWLKKNLHKTWREPPATMCLSADRKPAFTKSRPGHAKLGNTPSATSPCQPFYTSRRSVMLNLSDELPVFPDLMNATAYQARRFSRPDTSETVLPEVIDRKPGTACTPGTSLTTAVTANSTVQQQPSQCVQYKPLDAHSAPKRLARRPSRDKLRTPRTRPTESLALRKRKCPHCEYRSNAKTNMDTHVRRMHLKIKPFHCELCDYRTADRSNLRAHSIGIHNLKPESFACTQCKFKSINPSFLREHMVMAHCLPLESVAELPENNKMQTGNLVEKTSLCGESK